MSILKYKYKAHKLVNTLFYVVVFGIGFVLGFGAEKIDFNKLVSQVLMIDNVSATTMYTYNGITIDEDYIYEIFMERSNHINEVQPDFDISVFPYIYCNIYNTSTSDRTDPRLTCVAFKEEKLSPDNLNFYKNSSSYYGGYINMVRDNGINENPDVIGFQYRIVSKEFTSIYPSVLIYSSNANFYTNFSKSNVSNGGYTTIPDSNFHNTLDFSKYSVKLEYNENLFKDNPDFKEVCVNNYDTFSITSNEIQDYDDNNNPVFHDFDFIWFQNGLAYLSAWQYDSESSTHVSFYDDPDNSLVGWGYWLDTKEEIDRHFGNDNPGMYLELKGYEDKYSYYNWTLYPFEMTFTTDYHFYTIFSFSNTYLKQSGISPNAQNAYIKYLDGTTKHDSEKYCFYIKNQYDVNILNKNENGDFNSTITILGGINKDDTTYELELSKSYNGFFSVINNFINDIRETVVFINTYILELYTSMPLIVRSFIISFLVLIVIRILIGMVVK